MSETTTTNGSAGGGGKEPGAGWTNGDIPPPAALLLSQTREGRLELYHHHRRWIGLGSGWTRIGQGASEIDARHTSSQSTTTAQVVNCLKSEAIAIRALISQLCEAFYQRGWATGTGGGVSIRVGGGDDGDNRRPWRVFVAPSGIQKEDMIGEDIFELDMDRNVVEAPKTPNLRQSACTPLWYVVYRNRPHAKCVIHTHSLNAQLATLLDPTEQTKSLKVTHLEMIKGVGGHAYDDVLEIPIIDNRPTEDALAEQFEAAVKAYPKCNAVLVRRHGVYVWGDSWEQAKTQCESFDYLFESAVKMKSMGLNVGAPPASGTYRVNDEEEEPPQKKVKTLDEEDDAWKAATAAVNQADQGSNTVPILPRDAKYLLLDIEGCTTSIAFVKQVLFPYVKTYINAYLQQQAQNNMTDQDKEKLCQDLAKEVAQAGGNVDDDNDDLNARCAKLVIWLVDNDVKAAALKELQGKLWKAGYEHGALKSHVYADVKPMLEWMQSHGVKVYIYSSGSIQAQKLLFGYSPVGDLKSLLAGHFDIPSAGPKKQATSYTKICQELGIHPKQLVFCSDALAELQAAEAAGVGWQIMSIRPGNAPLNGTCQYPTIHSLLQLCGAE